MVPPSSVETHHQIVWISLSIKNKAEAGKSPLLRGPEMMLFDHEASFVHYIHDPLSSPFYAANTTCIEQKRGN